MKEYVSWADVDKWVNDLVTYCKNQELTFDGVYGLPRGGLVFAVMLSHRMHIPLLSAPTARSLIVDDICDSGESLVHFLRNSSNPEEQIPFVATMYCKDNQLNIKPTYYSRVKFNNWIVFPWESQED